MIRKFAVLIGFLLILEGAVSIETQTAFGLPTPYVVVSGSMLPTLPIGSVVVTEPISYSNVKVGDIIIYREDNINIVHRVVSITSHGIITKGDHNLYADEPRFWPPLQPDQIEAKVLLTIPYAGLVSMEFPVDFRYLFAVALLTITISSILIENKSKQPKQKRDHGEV